MSQQSKVSVVTPFYNPAPYFRQCVESVLAQSYQNFDFVLVDNQSTDGSGELAEEFARRDARVRVVHNATFLNQQANHNEAMRQIAPDAKYVKLLQADDWLFPSCLAEMVACAEENPRIGMVSALTLRETRVALSGLPYPSRYVPGREVCRRYLLEELNPFGSPTASLIRADIVRSLDPFYDEKSLIDDLEAAFKVLKVSDFGFVHQVLTFTRRDNVSAMSILKPFGLPVLSHPMMLAKFGAHFLAPDEIARRKREVDWYEYRTLAQGWLRRYPRGFWELHERCLGQIGEKISMPRVAWHVFATLMSYLLNPKMSFDALAARLQARGQ
jgi:glycosyltransferase involved in cell wall biosynthesis